MHCVHEIVESRGWNGRRGMPRGILSTNSGRKEQRGSINGVAGQA